MAELLVDEMEFSDGSSYDMVDFEDFCHALSDSEEELSKNFKSLEIDHYCAPAPDSSDMELDHYCEPVCNNELYKEYRYRFETILYSSEFNRKVKLDIRDVVKEHVLPFLPAKSLVRFRTVSKDWDKWILNPFLAHKQTNSFRVISGFICQKGVHTPTFTSLDQSAYGVPGRFFDFLPAAFFVVRSSCNGLLLCQGHVEESIYYICNPITEEFKELPQPHYYYHGSDSSSAVLAYEPSVLNFFPKYNLVCAVRSIDKQSVCFDIYSSESKSWRRSPVECFELAGDSRLKNCGLYMKGVAYWETSCGNILAFDVTNEIYAVLPLPASCASQGVLVQMHGEVCYVFARYQTEERVYLIDIYGGGMGFGLKQRVSIDVNLVANEIRMCRALPCVDSDSVLIRIGHSVYSYHLRAGHLEKLISRDSSDFEATYVPYVNSLVSLGPDE